MQKGVFFRHFFGFGGFVFLLSVFLCFCFVQNSPKWLFSCIFRGFLSLLFPQKACLKVVLFFLFCFILLLSSLSKIHFLFAFYPSTPFYRRLFVGFLFFFFCLPFPFLRFACLFDTNFPNIPFLKSNLLSFLAVYLCILLFLFLFSLCMFQPFCFFIVMLALFLVFFVVLFCVLFVSSFLFCFQSMKKKAVFPAILVFF